MLETYDTRVKVDKEAYQQWFPRLQAEVRNLQQAIREAKVPVLMILEGFRLAGRTDLIWNLGHSFDPRGLAIFSRTQAIGSERHRHWLRPYWMRLPMNGRIAIFDQSWYSRVLSDRVYDRCSKADWSRAYLEINQTEELLVADGAILLKFWLHISKKDQRKALRRAEENPLERYTLQKEDYVEHEHYDDYRVAADEMLERTSTHRAPWIVVEAGDPRYMRLKVFQTMSRVFVEGLSKRRAVQASPPVKPMGKPVSVPVLDEMPTILDKIDYSKTLTREDYEEQKDRLQGELRLLQRRLIEKDHRVVVVFEGWDAAGKGGTIRRLTANLDLRYTDVIPISKPTDEEIAHHYLWRFWRYLPEPGHLTVFDRSWYGRVLVERVEGFCSEEAWKRSYQEINEFESLLHREGISIIKFWLDITDEEQLKRFNERKVDPDKNWKLTDEDWRNREKWGPYRDAIEEMVARTSTTYAPWHIIPANCKFNARVLCLETMIDVLSRDLTLRGKKDKGAGK